MRLLMTRFTPLLCAAVLYLAIHPGWEESLKFSLMCSACLVVASAPLLLVLVLRHRRRALDRLVFEEHTPAVASRRLILMACASVVATTLLVATNSPMLLAFALSQAAFERTFATTVRAGERTSVHRHVGLYYVHDCYRGESGALYCRTSTSQDFFYLVSNGFVLRSQTHAASGERLPWGWLRPATEVWLMDSWFTFEAQRGG
jgi:hypothetical protein